MRIQNYGAGDGSSSWIEQVQTRFGFNPADAEQRQELGRRLRSCRERLGLSIRQLSAICNNLPGSSSPTLSKIENGVFESATIGQSLTAIEESLRVWMADNGYSQDSIELEIFNIFTSKESQMYIAARCELISPAIKFFGFTQDPFDVDRIPSQDEFFTNPELDQITSRVMDAVLYKRFVAVTGHVGSGKTSLKIRVLRQLDEWSEKRGQKVYIVTPEFFDMNAVSVGAIAAAILQEFDSKVPQTSTARVKKIKEVLTAIDKEEGRVAIVFDECHHLNERVIRALKNFWEMTNGGYSRLLGVVLFGQPQFVNSTLREVKFREIAERVQVLEMPLISKSAEAFLRHKIAAAGGDIDRLFDKAAIQRICSVARTPLALGNVANSALMEAFRLEEPRVVAQMLRLPDAPTVRNIRTAA